MTDQSTQPLTEDEWARIEKLDPGFSPGTRRLIATVKEARAEVSRLRAENTALASSLDQFRYFPDNPGPGEWSTSYRMGYSDAGRDVRALVRALDQNEEGQANGNA